MFFTVVCVFDFLVLFRKCHIYIIPFSTTLMHHCFCESAWTGDQSQQVLLYDVYCLFTSLASLQCGHFILDVNRVLLPYILQHHFQATLKNNLYSCTMGDESVMNYACSLNVCHSLCCPDHRYLKVLSRFSQKNTWSLWILIATNLLAIPPMLRQKHLCPCLHLCVGCCSFNCQLK